MVYVKYGPAILDPYQPFANNTGNVSVIDGSSDRAITNITVGHGIVNFIAVNASTNMVYVTNQADSTISIIDGRTNAVVKNITGLSTIYDFIAVNPSTNMVYVTNGPDESISVIDGTTNSVVKTISAGKGPYAAAVNPNP